LDRQAIQQVGVPGAVLMENAGRAAALLLQHLWPRGRVSVVCGGGNNGGDGVVLARTLASWGRAVTLVEAAPGTLRRDLLHGWAPPVEREPSPDRGEDGGIPGLPDLVVDALLGTGARGAPRAPVDGWIRRINATGLPVIALDVPSGVDSDLGHVPGEVVQAALTVAFGWPKLGLLLHPARPRVGRLVAVEIGFPPVDLSRVRAVAITPGWAHSHRPRRSSDTHKNRVGSLLLVAGSPGMAGAAILAGRGALRGGVGLLRVASDPANREILQGALPEAIFVDLSDPRAMGGALEASGALAVGPGLGIGERVAGALVGVLEGEPRPTVMDADALNLAAAGALPALDRLGEGRPLLLTPHPGEMARLLEQPRDEVQHDRPGAARRGAQRFRCALLLKGAPSLVATPDGVLRVDGGGSSDLATAGMGDVLTGVCGALLAGGMAPGDAGALGLHLTGRSALLAHRGAGLSPMDVAEGLPDALRESGNGVTDLPFGFVTFDQDAPS
jgi:ADP-dependent NAD(P)H-hydrate dehydratase / NAD(P)H-hydrate epimerase